MLKSNIWNHFEISEVTQNMQLKCLSNDPIQKQSVAEFAAKYCEPEFLKERAILCLQNRTTKEVHEHIMSQIQGEEVAYRSLDMCARQRRITRAWKTFILLSVSTP